MRYNLTRTVALIPSGRISDRNLHYRIVRNSCLHYGNLLIKKLHNRIARELEVSPTTKLSGAKLMTFLVSVSRNFALRMHIARAKFC